MRFMLILILIIPGICLAESGMYQLQGLSFNPDAPDSAATFTGATGYWQETIGHSLTVIPASATISTQEESFGIGALQAMRLWKRVVIGAGAIMQHYDDKTDYATPVNYLTARLVGAVFLQDVSIDWRGRWGFGISLDYAPGMKAGQRKSITIGLVGLM